MTDTTEGPTRSRGERLLSLAVMEAQRQLEHTQSIQTVAMDLGVIEYPQSVNLHGILGIVWMAAGLDYGPETPGLKREFREWFGSDEWEVEEVVSRLGAIKAKLAEPLVTTKPAFDPDLSHLCESPIETAFYDACAAVSHEFGGDFHPTPQVEIGDYRVDFAIQEYEIAIELDGHDYHKTKEQRTADAKRDRFLTSIGWTVYRFTGSEIWADAAACANELYDRWSEEEVTRAQRLAAREPTGE